MLKKIFIIYLRGKNFVNSIKWVLFLVGYLFLLFGKVWWMGFGCVGLFLIEVDFNKN